MSNKDEHDTWNDENENQHEDRSEQPQPAEQWLDPEKKYGTHHTGRSVWEDYMQKRYGPPSGHIGDKAEAKLRKQFDTELSCELRDPCGTIWECYDKLHKEHVQIKTQLEQMDDERISWKAEAELRGKALAAARAEVERLKESYISDMATLVKAHKNTWDKLAAARASIQQAGQMMDDLINKAQDMEEEEIADMFIQIRSKLI